MPAIDKPDETDLPGKFRKFVEVARLMGRHEVIQSLDHHEHGSVEISMQNLLDAADALEPKERFPVGSIWTDGVRTLAVTEVGERIVLRDESGMRFVSVPIANWPADWQLVALDRKDRVRNEVEAWIADLISESEACCTDCAKDAEALAESLRNWLDTSAENNMRALVAAHHAGRPEHAISALKN